MSKAMTKSQLITGLSCKYCIINSLLLAIIFTLLFSKIASAENKIFIKEYTYQAGELDSKVTSRINALEQAKKLLLEELGVLIISETEVDKFDELVRSQTA